MVEQFQRMHSLQLTGTLLDILLEGNLSRVGSLSQVPALDKDQLAYSYFVPSRAFALGSSDFVTSYHQWWESLRQGKLYHFAECVFRLSKPAESNREKEELKRAIDLVLNEVGKEIGLDFEFPSRGYIYTWPCQIEGLFYCQKVIRLLYSRLADQPQRLSMATMELLACSAFDSDKLGLKWNALCVVSNLLGQEGREDSLSVAEAYATLTARANSQTRRQELIKQLNSKGLEVAPTDGSAGGGYGAARLGQILEKCRLDQLRDVASSVNPELLRGKMKKQELVDRLASYLAEQLGEN